MYERPPEQPSFHAYQEQHTSPYAQSYTNYTSNASQAYTDDQGSLYPQHYAAQQGPSPAAPADAISLASEKPVAAKPTVEPHISPTSSLHADSTAPTKPHLLSQRNDFLLDWALKILGVASAILFGIWAPISYKITADGNAGNDAAQASLMSEMSSMRDEAATAASAQRDAVSALANVQNQLDNVGLIWAWDFCSGRDDPVCTEISSSATILEALSSLGGLGGTRASSRTSSAPSPTTAPVSGSPGGTVSSKNLLAIILGSVFGGIVIIGLIVGILAKRRQQRKLLEESHS